MNVKHFYVYHHAKSKMKNSILRHCSKYKYKVSFVNRDMIHTFHFLHSGGREARKVLATYVVFSLSFGF